MGTFETKTCVGTGMCGCDTRRGHVSYVTVFSWSIHHKGMYNEEYKQLLQEWKHLYFLRLSGFTRSTWILSEWDCSWFQEFVNVLAKQGHWNVSCRAGLCLWHLWWNCEAWSIEDTWVEPCESCVHPKWNWGSKWGTVVFRDWTINRSFTIH